MDDGRPGVELRERTELVVKARLLDRDLGPLLEQVGEQVPAVLGELGLELELGRPRAAPVEQLDRQLGVALGAEPLADSRVSAKTSSSRAPLPPPIVSASSRSGS